MTVEMVKGMGMGSVEDRGMNTHKHDQLRISLVKTAGKMVIPQLRIQKVIDVLLQEMHFFKEAL